MKLLFGYTAKGFMKAGLTLPSPTINTWQVVGASPFYFYQGLANSVGPDASGEELQYNIINAYIYARGFDLLTRLAADEVLTFGYRYRGTFSSVSALGLAGISNAPSRASVYPVMWSDGGSDDPNTVRDLFIEVTIDPTERTATGYINGKKTRTLPIPANFSYAEVNLCFMSYLAGASAVKLGNHFYAAIFKKTEITHLTAWECEDLVEVSNELRDGDGVLNRNTVNEAWKSVVYALPTKPLEAVSADMKLLNPQGYSTCLTELNDGTTSSTYAIQAIGASFIDTEFGNTTTGKTTAGISPSKQATQLTLKLKAVPPQE